MALQAVLFDLDGTLINFQIDYKKARKITIEILEKYGYTKGKFSTDMLVLEMINSAFDFFASDLNFSVEKIGEIGIEVGEEVEKVEAEAAQKASPFPSIEMSLNYLSALGIQMGILTFNTTKNAVVSLEKAGLDDFFPDSELIIGRDQVDNPKPNAEHAQILMERMYVQPDQCVVIGDHPRDIECGKNAGTRTIAFVTREHTPDEFEMADHVIMGSEVGDKLLPILQSMMNS